MMLGVEMSIAVGTSLLIIAANSAAGVLFHLHDAASTGVRHCISWHRADRILVAGQLGTKLDNTRLQRWFAYLVFLVAAYVLVDTLLLR